MREGPAEVHLDIDDLTVANREDLGVAESVAIRIAPFIRDKDAIAIGTQMNDVEPFDCVAVRPAPSEVRFAVETIVQRAREMKIGVALEGDCIVILRPCD